jgi:hypothetical protein
VFSEFNNDEDTVSIPEIDYSSMFNLSCMQGNMQLIPIYIPFYILVCFDQLYELYLNRRTCHGFSVVVL